MAADIYDILQYMSDRLSRIHSQTPHPGTPEPLKPARPSQPLQTPIIDLMFPDPNIARQKFQERIIPFVKHVNDELWLWQRPHARAALREIEGGNYSTPEALAERLKEVEVLEKSYGFVPTDAAQQSWARWLAGGAYNTAAAVGSALTDLGGALAVTGASIAAQTQFINPKLAILREFTSRKSLEDVTEQKALLVNGRVNRKSWELWSRRNLIQDLNNPTLKAELAKLDERKTGGNPKFVLKEALRHRNLSPVDKERIEQYRLETTGAVFGITVNIASRITKTTLRGVPTAAERGTFDKLLSPEGIDITLGALNRFAQSIADAPNKMDLRPIKEIEKETKKKFKTAADQIALAMIPPSWNPVNWIYRKLLSSSLQDYYFGELAGIAYAGKTSTGKPGTDTALGPAVSYLQAVNGFDSTNLGDDKTKALRIESFANLVSTIAKQLGEKPKQPAAQIINTQPVADLLGKIDLQRLGGVGPKTQHWTSWIAGFSSVRQTIDGITQNVYQQAVTSQIMPWLHGKKP